MSIDLHIHSTFSDGTCSPLEIVKLAKKLGLSAISITDHDTLSGIEETVAAAKVLKLEAISGIELSVRHNTTYMHMLGYFIDHNCQELNKKIKKLQDARDERNIQIIHKLNEQGIAIHIDEVKSVSKIGQTGRPHIAQVLRSKGVVNSIDDAFTKYLKRGACAYVSRFVYSAGEAINMIKRGGGIAVLAHPAQLDPSLAKLPKLLDDLVGLGLDGLEMYYPTHSTKMRRRLKKISKKHDLIFSGGSDYHGDIRPGTNLAGGINVCVPDDVLERMKQKWIMGKNRQ